MYVFFKRVFKSVSSRSVKMDVLFEPFKTVQLGWLVIGSTTIHISSYSIVYDTTKTRMIYGLFLPRNGAKVARWPAGLFSCYQHFGQRVLFISASFITVQIFYLGHFKISRLLLVLSKTKTALLHQTTHSASYEPCFRSSGRNFC